MLVSLGDLIFKMILYHLDKIIYINKKGSINMDNKKSVRLTISLSDIENKQLTAQAQQCGLSKAAYIREQTLSGRVVNSLPEAKIRSIIAELYTFAEHVEDITIRKQLRKEADQLWQFLK